MSGRATTNVTSTLMEPDESEMTLRDYLRVIARRKGILVTAILFALVGSLAITLLQEPIYQAEAQLLVQPRSGDTVFEDDPAVNVQNLERAIQTEIQVVEGQRVRTRVREDLGLDTDPPRVNASAVGSTDIVSVKVRSADPETAQVLADAYTEAYITTRREQAVDDLDAATTEMQEKVAELQERIDEIDQQVADAPARSQGDLRASLSGQRQALVNQQATFNERIDVLQVDTALITGGASVVRTADLPEQPVEPTPVRTTALALVVGIILGLGAAFLVDHFDDSINVEADLHAVTATPVLAVVPVHPPPDNRPIAVSEPNDPSVEIYRGLRTNVQFLGLDARMRVIQVTSSLPGEGKTTTAANLAVVLAQAGHNVVLVDADLRKPMLHRVFSIPQQRGLTDLLLGDLIDLVVSQVDGGLHVIPSGNVPPNPSEMLASDRTAKLLEELANRFEYVIVDSAPTLPVSDSLALAAAADGVLHVSQARRASKRNVADSFERLERVTASPVGMILNRAKTRRRGSGYGYGYGYAYTTSSRQQAPSSPDETPTGSPSGAPPRTF